MSEQQRFGTRLFDACIAVFVAALALYTAAWFLQQVWPWLLAIAVVAVPGWLWLVQRRRW